MEVLYDLVFILEKRTYICKFTCTSSDRVNKVESEWEGNMELLSTRKVIGRKTIILRQFRALYQAPRCLLQNQSDPQFAFQVLWKYERGQSSTKSRLNPPESFLPFQKTKLWGQFVVVFHNKPFYLLTSTRKPISIDQSLSQIFLVFHGEVGEEQGGTGGVVLLL